MRDNILMNKTGLLHRVTRLIWDSHFLSDLRGRRPAPKRPPVCLLLVLGFCLSISANPLRAQTDPFTGMVAFGDSLSDGGNLNYLLNGVTEKTANYLTGWDPNYYYNYRFSNGPIWVDQLYTRLGFGDIGTMGANDGGSNINGTNFSWAGSRSGTGSYGLIFPNLQSQISSYSSQLSYNTALPAPATTLFTIWSGANDVFAHVENADPITPYAVADNIATAITTLYGDGGRYFLVLNLPPIGLIPSYINDPIKGDLANAFVDIYNNQIDTQLDALSASLEGITIYKVDIHSLFLDITANFEAYGFTNITDAAYVRYEPYEPRDPPYGELTPNSEGYFYWDAAHGTTAANAYIAGAAYQSVIPEPATWMLILAAGLFVAVTKIKRSPSSR